MWSPPSAWSSSLSSSSPLLSSSSWDTIPRRLLDRWKELPNWWKRERKDLECKLKGPDAETHTPSAVYAMLEKRLHEATNGITVASTRKQTLPDRSIVRIATDMLHEYTREAEKRSAEIAQTNLEIVEKFDSGELSFSDALSKSLVPITIPKGKPSMTWARRFRERYGWGKKSVNTPGIYLDFNDPRMVKFRKRNQERWAMHDCRPHLRFNWDQLWKSKYRSKPTKLHKHKSQVGQKKHRSCTSVQRKALKHARAEAEG